MDRKQSRFDKSGRRPGPGSPEVADALRRAASAFQSGRLQECEVICRRVLAVDPGDATANLIIGVLAFGSGHNEDAIGFFKASIARNDKNSDAHANLGAALARAGKPLEAKACLETAIQINPSALDAYLNLANVETSLGFTERAAPLFAKALELKGDNFEMLLRYANALMQNGEAEKAAAQYSRALEIKPGDSAATSGLGIALLNMGELDEAKKLIRSVVEAEGFISDATLSLVWLDELSESDIERIVDMRTQFEEGDKRQASFDFALSEIEHKRGDYAAAARYLRSANASERARLSYDASKKEREFENIISVFDADFFARRPDFGCQDETPIFVVGMPRSGTSLTEQILSSHPDVYGAGELKALGLLKYQNPDYGSPDASLANFARTMDKRTSAEVGQIYVDRLRQIDSKARFVVDKMPSNFILIGLIRLILPKAKIIHCLRDPRETCLSNYRTNFANESLGYTFDLDELIHYYGLYRKLMDHWYSLFGAEIIEVDHAKLVQDSESEIRKLLAACDLEFAPQCLEFHKTKRSVQTASVTQVRQPIYDPTKRGWRKYAEYLPELHALDKYVDPT